MPVISLRDVIDALNLESAEVRSYLDPESGEIITLNTEQEELALKGDWDSLPDWMKESRPKFKRAVQDHRLLKLPDTAHLDEWKIMRDFAEEQDSRKANAELLSAIELPEALLTFNRVIQHLELEHAWSEFRSAAMDQIAREWLQQHRLAYR